MKKKNLKYEYTLDDIMKFLIINNKKKQKIKNSINVNTELKWEKIVN